MITRADTSGGSVEAGARRIQIDPSGQFEDADSIGNVIVNTSNAGADVSPRPGADQPRVAHDR